MNESDFDFASLDIAAAADRGAELHVRDPISGQPLEVNGASVTIRLAGEDSGAYRHHERAAINRRLENRQRNKVTAESLETDTINALAAVTLGWSNIGLDGQDLPFNQANARTLYRRFHWLREQVNEFVATRANFLPKLSTNS